MNTSATLCTRNLYSLYVSKKKKGVKSSSSALPLDTGDAGISNASQGAVGSRWRAGVHSPGPVAGLRPENGLSTQMGDQSKPEQAVRRWGVARRAGTANGRLEAAEEQNSGKASRKWERVTGSEGRKAKGEKPWRSLKELCPAVFKETKGH